MPDRRRPRARPGPARTARTDPAAAILTAVAGGRQPVDRHAIAAAAGLTASRAGKVLKLLHRAGRLRWIARAQGGPGYALPLADPTGAPASP